MQGLVAGYIFLIGIAFGSFALAMVDRMHAGKDWVKGRSACDFCKHKLAPVDLIPLYSWISNAGKCRYCNKKLSKTYPVSELVLGLMFVLSFMFFPYELSASGWLLFALWLFALVLCMALVLFDIRWFLLPSTIVYSLVFVSLLHRLVFITASSESVGSLIIKTIASLLVASGFFFVLHVLSKGKWIGDGDVRLGLAIGLLVEGPVHAWLVIFIASLLGVIVALPKLLKDGRSLKMKLPYGPLLISGLCIVYLFGSSIIDWYSSTFLQF